MKICSKCKRLLSTDNFRKDSRSSDGLMYACIPCVKAISKTYRESPEAKERRARYLKDNRERLSEQRHAYNSAYYAKHRDKVRAAGKVWASENKEKRKILDSRKHALLSDGYVRVLLLRRTSLKAKDIPQGLVEAKRIHLRILRELKTLEGTP